MTISTARLQPVGSIVTVSGIVTNGSELSTIRYFQDSTGGIAVYDSNVTYFMRGDSITVTGTLVNYNNLLEISTVTAHAVHSSGNAMPIPFIVTPGQFAELYESCLVQINNAVFDNAGSTFAGGSSYSFTANNESSTVYIRAGHPLIGELIPGNPVTLIGICSQFYANFQLLLRDTNDIINNSSINIITPVDISNISTSGFTLSWETDSAGTTNIFYGNTPLLEAGELYSSSLVTSHEISITGASPSELFYIKAFSVRDNDTAFSNMSAQITQSLSSGDMKVYFTRDVDNSVSSGTDAIFLDDLIDDTLINYINRAKYSIDIAIYDFNTVNVEDIAGALNNAAIDGVDIRVIYDTTWAAVDFGSLIPTIHSIIAPVTSDYGIMHNKFVVIDALSSDPNDPIVWTGSTNFEDENINEFANNVIIIQDKSLAIAYKLEYDEMWGSETPTPESSNSKFGPYKTDNTPHEFIIGGNRVECYFSPSDDATDHIIKSIQSSDYELFAETMLITRLDISDAIVERNSNGVLCKVIVNDDADCNTTVVSNLTSALTYYFREYGEPGILHNKTLIADALHANSDPLVLTGSHNWSNNAENRNDENTLIIHNPEIANIYYQEFKRRFDNGISLSAVEDLITDEFYSLYPNPFSDDFCITISSDGSEIYYLEIFNIEGKKIYSRKINSDEFIKNLKISDFNGDSGIYLLKLNGSNGSSSFKIIKE